MRIATYNLWNSDMGMPMRTSRLSEQIRSVGADILCLQEVRDRAYYEQISEESNYPYGCFFIHADEQEGLAVLSKFPITKSFYMTKAIMAEVTYGDKMITVVNLHLDWDSALSREKEIVEIVKSMEGTETDYAFLAGDFNCSPDSGVHRFLLGQQSLRDEEANPYWYDLAEGYGNRMGSLPDVTVDFRNNPRWQRKNTIEVNQRFDRILMRNSYPKDFPQLVLVETFGKETDEETLLAPSDHWGVFADLVF